MIYRDPIVTFCAAHGLSLDREVYLAIAYPDGEPERWAAEHEAELPEIFQEPRKWRIESKNK